MDNKFNLQLDYYGVVNLHKALLEAKFHLNPDNESVAASPLIADLYIQVRDFLIENDKSNCDKSESWKEWFQLKNRTDYREHAITLLRKYNRWNKASFDEKKKITGNFLAPFFYTETELNAIITQIDQYKINSEIV